MARIGWRGVFPAVTTQFPLAGAERAHVERIVAEAARTRPSLRLAAE